MRERLDIATGTEVVFVGRSNHFEIWNKENLDTLRKIDPTLPENKDSEK